MDGGGIPIGLRSFGGFERGVTRVVVPADEGAGNEVGEETQRPQRETGQDQLLRVGSGGPGSAGREGMSTKGAVPGVDEGCGGPEEVFGVDAVEGARGGVCDEG